MKTDDEGVLEKREVDCREGIAKEELLGGFRSGLGIWRCDLVVV